MDELHRRARQKVHGNSVGQSNSANEGADSYGARAALGNQTIPSQGTYPYGGIKVGELIGHRVWRVVNRTHIDVSKMRLQSAVVPFTWPPGEIMRGELLTGGVYRRDVGGIYSYKSVEYLMDYGPAINGAIGTIEMWGDVVEHTLGYRATHARVRSIDLIRYESSNGLIKYESSRLSSSENIANILKTLREIYGV